MPPTKWTEECTPAENVKNSRRIIGMIKALGENPENCGYTATQITGGLDALAKKSVKQIGSDAAQLYFMMLDQNLIERNDFNRKSLKKPSRDNETQV